MIESVCKYYVQKGYCSTKGYDWIYACKYYIQKGNSSTKEHLGDLIMYSLLDGLKKTYS